MDENYDLEESVESDKLNPENNIAMDEPKKAVDLNKYKFHQRYYLVLKCIIVSLIGFGSRLRHCLRNEDDYRLLMEKYKILWNIYSIFCLLIIHLSIIANISTLIYVYIYGKRRLQSYSLSTIIIICNITAIFAVDMTLKYRKLRTNLIKDICDENFIFDSSKQDDNETEGRTCFSNCFNRFIHSTCLEILESKDHSRTTFLIITFTIPIICHIFFIVSIVFKILDSDWLKLERSFFHFNMIIILFNMLQYIVICMVLRMKFVGLNKFLTTLIREKITLSDDLEIIIRWYKHNYNQVKNFDEIHNIFILLCFIFNCSLIAYIIYELLIYFHWIDIIDILLVILIIPLTIITFKSSSDIENISSKSKKLIEEYMLCNDLKNNSSEFNSSCQSFHSILLSKPVNLTLLGLKSISITTIVFFLFFVFTKSTEIISILEYIKPKEHNSTNLS